MNATTQTRINRALKHRGLIVAAGVALILSSVAGAGRLYLVSPTLVSPTSQPAAVTPAVVLEPASSPRAVARDPDLITLEEQVLVSLSPTSQPAAVIRAVAIEPASSPSAVARDPDLITLEEQVLVSMLGLR